MAINRDKVHASAAKLLQQGKYDKAIAELVKLVEDDPTDVRTWLKLGENYPKIGRKKEALDAFEKAANIYAEQGFFLKAVAVLKQLLRVDPNVPPMHLKLAELYQQLGLTPDALQHYQNVAVFYEQQGRPRDTLDILKRMVDLDPDNLPSRIKLGELFAAQGLQAEAVQELRSSLGFLKTQGRLDDFARVAEKLIAYDAGAVDVVRELSEIYLKQNQPSLALSKLQIAFKTDARNVETLTLMAQAFLDLQQVPKTVLVYKELAKIHATDGNADAARAQWERVLDLAPEDAEAAMALGRAVSPMGHAAPTILPEPASPTYVSPAPTSSRAVPTLPGGGAPAASLPGSGLPGSGLPGSGLSGGGLPGSGLPGGGLPGAAPSGGGAATGADPNAELLTRLMTETDVYVKYGLKDKALEHLKRIYAIDSQHIPALEKEKQLMQAQGGRELKEVLRRLVAAADEQGHPRLQEWKTELKQTANVPTSMRPSTATGMPPVSAAGMRAAPAPAQAHIDLQSDEDIVIDSQEGAAEILDEPIIEDPSGQVSLARAGGPTASRPDASFLPDDIQSLPDLPPDEGVTAPVDFAMQEASPLGSPPVGMREIPRMPSGVMAAPSILPLAQPRTPAPPLVLDEAAVEAPDELLESESAAADEIVRQALRDISQEELLAATDDLLLGANEEEILSADGAIVEESPNEPMIPAPSARAPSPSPLESALVQAGSQEGEVETAINAEDLLIGTDSRPPEVTTALVGLSSAELDEIREFEGGTHDDENIGRAPRKPVASVPSIPSGAPALPPEMMAQDDGWGFDEPTLALPPDRSSDSPTGERQREPPTMSAAQPSHVASEPSGELDAASFDLPDDVKRMLGGAPAAGSAQAPPQAAPVGHALASPTGEVTVPREAPAPAGGKLGLASKAQGFEDDQANQFFPDELEEAEFFIQQELLDEAREILTSILEDVPDSARVAWMMSRIDAKEAGEPEPPAPWEKRILEEVEAQLADMDLPPPPPEPAGDRQVSVDEVLQQFKKGIAETVPEDDAATHYDLGCAYRDMGLLDEALAEFDIAARAPSRAADARYLIGVTLSDQGKNDDAIESLNRALGTVGATRDQRAACHYQIGVCHEMEKRFTEAQLAFKQAKASGHAAIDLDRRIAALVAKVGDVSPGNGAGHGHAAGAPSIGKSKNIDYL